MNPARADAAVRNLSIGLTLAFLAYWSVVCLRYGVNLPFMDQWDRPVAQIDAMFHGRLTFEDFWTQHNESRKVMPMVISLGLAKALGRYNTHAELAIGMTFLAAIAFAIVRLAQATSVAPAALFSALYLAIAGVGRSLYIHLYSITFEGLIVELALIASLTVLMARGLTRRTASLVAILLTIGLFSHSSAVTLWIVVPTFALIAFRHAWRQWLLLMGCGLASLTIYFWSYTRPLQHTPLVALFHQSFVDWIRFALRFLGNPIARDTTTASVVAAGMLAAFVVASIAAYRRAPRAALAWMTVGAYSIGEAVIAMALRLPMSLDHASRGDYMIHASYLYVATGALTCIALNGRRWVPAWLLLPSLASFVMLLTPGQRVELLGMHNAMVAARGCALAGTDCNPRNMWLQPNIETVRDRAAKARAAGVWP